MTTPADIEPAIEATLVRAARELKQVREALARIETLLQLIASAAATSPGAPQRLTPSADSCAIASPPT